MLDVAESTGSQLSLGPKEEIAYLDGVPTSAVKMISVTSNLFPHLYRRDLSAIKEDIIARRTKTVGYRIEVDDTPVFFPELLAQSQGVSQPGFVHR
jgi:hypothetical protein